MSNKYKKGDFVIYHASNKASFIVKIIKIHKVAWLCKYYLIEHYIYGGICTRKWIRKNVISHYTISPNIPKFKIIDFKYELDEKVYFKVGKEYCIRYGVIVQRQYREQSDIDKEGSYSIKEISYACRTTSIHSEYFWSVFENQISLNIKDLQYQIGDN